ncbi:chemotaxis protein, partial [Pseudomonas putida]
MFGYLNRRIGNISVGAKLALGFAVVLLLTVATAASGWRALDDAITRSEQLSEIGQINDLVKDLRAERITYRVLADEASKAQITRILQTLDAMLTALHQRSSVDESRQMLAQKLQLLQRLHENFATLQRTVESRRGLREAMQAQEQKLNGVIDELE